MLNNKSALELFLERILASRKFKMAINETGKTIDHFQKMKDSLLPVENNLRLANNKDEDWIIKN